MQIKYSVFITMVTFTSLTMCEFSYRCPGLGSTSGLSSNIDILISARESQATAPVPLLDNPGAQHHCWLLLRDGDDVGDPALVLDR